MEYKLNQKLNPDFKESWDKISITPGTPFMNKLNQRLHEHFGSQNKLSLPNRFIKLSDSSEVGEGEHKIFEFIRNHREELREKTMVVYGLDADLIMLGIKRLLDAAEENNQSNVSKMTAKKDLGNWPPSV